MTNQYSIKNSLIGVLAVSVAIGVSSCGSEPSPVPENSPVHNRTQPGPNTAGKPEEAPIPTRSDPLAVSPTEWPGIEARLMKCAPTGNMLVVEILLANTGSSPITIENYSAVEATATDDASKQLYGVHEMPGHPPAATSGLTQTLEPGATASVTATFPRIATANLVTLNFPRITPFTAVPITMKAQQATANAPPISSQNTNMAANSNAK